MKNSKIFFSRFKTHTVVSIEELKEYLECDEQFILELLQQFKVELENCMKEFDRVEDKADLKRIGYFAHKMLSSSRILGMETVTKLLEEIESCADKRELRSIPNLLIDCRFEAKKCLQLVNEMERTLAKSL